MTHEVPAPTAPPEIDTLTLRRLALDAESDPRSVAKELHGVRVKGIVGERIRRVLRAAGLPTSDSRREAA